jgi:hypothetical protein
MEDPTEKHFGDVGILDKYEDNNNNNYNNMQNLDLKDFWGITLDGLPKLNDGNSMHTCHCSIHIVSNLLP